MNGIEFLLLFCAILFFITFIFSAIKYCRTSDKLKDRDNDYLDMRNEYMQLRQEFKDIEAKYSELEKDPWVDIPRGSNGKFISRKDSVTNDRDDNNDEK